MASLRYGTGEAAFIIVVVVVVAAAAAAVVVVVVVVVVARFDELRENDCENDPNDVPRAEKETRGCFFGHWISSLDGALDDAWQDREYEEAHAAECDEQHRVPSELQTQDVASAPRLVLALGRLLQDETQEGEGRDASEGHGVVRVPGDHAGEVAVGHRGGSEAAHLVRR